MLNSDRNWGNNSLREDFLSQDLSFENESMNLEQEKSGPCIMSKQSRKKRTKSSRKVRKRPS